MTARDLVVAMVVFALGSSAALAQSDEVSGDVSGSVGMGLAANPDYEGSKDYQPLPLPYARVKMRDYYGELGYRPDMGAYQLRGNVVPSGTINVGPIINYRLERNDVEDKKVGELGKVDAAWEAGAFVDYHIDNGFKPGTAVGFNFQFAGDISDTHTGWLFLPNVYYRTSLGDSWNFSTSLYSTYATDNYMSTYFGIDAANAARSGLDEFNADAGFKDVGIGLGVTYNVTPSWNLDTAVRYKRLLDDAADSPVTKDQGSANQIFGGVLVRYKF